MKKEEENDDAMMKKDGDSMMEDEAMMKDAMEKVIVKYTTGGFSPKSVSVTAGQSVEFVNESGNFMWVASAVHPTHTKLPEFDQKSSSIKGTSYSFTFTKAGNWSYHNHVRPADTGTVEVK